MWGTCGRMHRLFTGRLLPDCEAFQTLQVRGFVHVSATSRFKHELVSNSLFSTNLSGNVLRRNARSFQSPVRSLLIQNSAKDERRWSSNCSGNVPLPFTNLPSASGFPLASTLELLWSGSVGQVHLHIHRRHAALGPMFKERLGHVEAVFLADPVLYRQVLQQEGAYPILMLPQPWIVYNEMYGRKRGLFFMQGEEWSEFRQIIAPLMLSNPEMECILSTIAKNNASEWGKVRIVPDVEERLYSYFLEGLVAIALGKSAEKFHMLEEFVQHVHTIFTTSASMTLVSPVWAAKLRLPVWNKFAEAASGALNIASDFVTRNLQIGEGVGGQLLAHGVPKDDVIRILTDLFLAAADTTSHTTQWVLYLLASHPEIQQRTREQLIMGKSSLLRGAIKEAMRLYPVATFLTRVLPEDAVVNNYLIPRGTLILYSLYTTGRDERYHTNPHLFWPERWSRHPQSSTALLGVKDSYASLPFGHGKRGCVGRRLAERQLELFLSEMEDLEKDVAKHHVDKINDKDENINGKINWEEGRKIYPCIRTASDFYQTARLTREKLVQRAAQITGQRYSYGSVPSHKSDSSDSENEDLLNSVSKVGSMPVNYSTLLAQPPEDSKLPESRESPKPPMKILEVQNEKEKPQRPKGDFWGILMAFLAGSAFTISSVGIKLVNRMDPTMVLLIRVCMQALVLVPYTIWHRQDAFQVRGHRLLLFSLGIVGSGVLIFCFIAYARLPVGDATSIIFSSPILVIVLSTCIFKEPCGVWRLLATLLLTTGIILISRPSAMFPSSPGPDKHSLALKSPFVLNDFIEFKLFNISSPELENLSFAAQKQNLSLLIVPNPNDVSVIASLLRAALANIPQLMNNLGFNNTRSDGIYNNETNSSEEELFQTEDESSSMDTFGVVAAMLSTTCMAVNYIITRQLKDVHHSTVLLVYSCMAALSSSVVVAATNSFTLPENAYEWGVVTGIGLSGLAGQLLLVLSLKRQTPSVVAVVRTLDIVLAYVFQVLLFNDIPRLSSLGGAAFVMIAVLIVTFEYSLQQIFACPCATDDRP